jgi:hypothetical protein
LEDRISELGSLSPAPARQPYRGGYGEPVVVPSDADSAMLEQKRQELEGKLLS